MRSKIFILCALITLSLIAHSANRTMIALQSEAVLDGQLGLREYMTATQYSTVRNIANAVVNTFTSSKSHFQGTDKYQRIVTLSGSSCKRANLLAELIKQSVDGFVVDLYIFGHGGPEILSLNGESLTGGSNGSLRSMLTEARQQKGSSFNFKLRLVYMGDCFASSLNDDWLAIGAKTSIGSEHLDYMPEPMAYSFVHNFINEQRTVAAAANTAFNDAKAFWTATSTLSQLVGANIGYLNKNDPKCDTWGSANSGKIEDCRNTTRIDQSKLVIAGNSKLIFADEHQLDVGQSRTFTIYANKLHNFVLLYVTAGETYTFTASVSDTWRNCSGCSLFEKVCNAAGYAKGPTDFPRHGNFNMMSMVGEHFRKFKDVATYNNVAFLIGRSKTYSPTSNGFINIMANDILTGYADNAGSIAATVKRTQ